LFIIDLLQLNSSLNDILDGYINPQKVSYNFEVFTCLPILLMQWILKLSLKNNQLNLFNYEGL